MPGNALKLTNDLSTREKKVLTSIIQYPSSPDIEIASIVGIKHSTFATIKKRLMKQKYFRKYYLPNISVMGAEIFNIDLRTISSCCQKESKRPDREISETFSFLREIPSVFFSLVESNLSFISSFNRNYSDLANSMMKFDNLAYQEQIQFSSHYKLNFPVFLSKFPRVLDFSRSLEYYLDESSPTSPLKQIFLPIDQELNITKLGWEVFLSLLHNPGSSPRKIANQLGKPKTTTTRWLRTFLQTGMLTTRILPNLGKLGYKIAFLSHITIMSTEKSSLEKAITIIDVSLTPAFLVQSAHDIFYISVFPSFRAAYEAEFDFIQRMNTEDIPFDHSFRYFLSLPHSTFITRLDASLVPLMNYLGEELSKPELTV
ncbi:MAG: MarR family transcriptional regulator [Candidatus Heimdallarchaeota archaeon]|nr:MarR family transcriptional regulator [Candidatus Heimdallarchaeota archaeon]